MRIVRILCLTPLCVLFFCFNSLQSQDIGNDLDFVFKQLDLTNLSTDILLDKGINLKSWVEFNGDFPADDLSTTINDWYWHYTCLEMASLNPLSSSYLPRERYIDLADTLTDEDTIPLSLLTLAFDKIKKTALDDELLFFDESLGYLQDNPQAIASPYELDTTYVGITTLSASTFGELSFVLPDTMILSNLGTCTYEIDFNDGLGFRPLIPNILQSVTYSSIGMKYIVFKINLDNGQSVYAKSKIDITDLEGSKSRRYDEPPFSLNIQTPHGSKAKFFPSNECDKIIKPLIYIEGFNPIDLFSTNWEIMLRKLDLIEGNGQGYNYPPGTGPTVWEDFYNAGYDVIFIDFADGAGDLFANAEDVDAIIRFVNQEKQRNNSNHKTTILAASMGGVIAYRTLTLMDNEGYDHEVGDFITFDSPLRGANIPFGLQSFVDIFSNTELRGQKVKTLFPLLAKVDNILNATATKQLLYFHVKAPESNRGIFHDIFFTELHRFGPPDVNHIAIANGSGIGEGQLIGPGEKILEISGIYDPPTGAGRLAFDKLRVFFANTPGASFNTVYRQRLYALLVGGTLIVPVGGNHEIEFSEDRQFDSAPGSSQNYGFPDRIRNIVSDPNLNFDFGSQQMQWCFVPTISALNIPGDPDPNITIGPDCGGGSVLRCTFSTDDSVNSPYNNNVPGLAPMPEHNQNHVSINTPVISYLLTNTHKLKILDEVLNNKNFNFGEIEEYPADNTWDNFSFWKTEDYIDHDLLVTGSGQLLINALDKIGCSTENNELTVPATNFKVRVQAGCNENITLTNENGGQIEVGHFGLNTTNTGELILSKNTRMIINSGGHTRVNKNSKLIIEDGAEIIVNDGGKLESREGVIEIKDGGILQINSNAELESSWGGEIFVREGGTLTIDGAEIDLQGTGGVLEVHGNLKIVNSFNFTDQGHIKFYPSHNIEILNGWTFVGSGKFDKNIELVVGTPLILSGSDIDFSQTEIKYNVNSKIEMFGGSFTSSGVNFKGNGENTTGLNLDNLSGVDIFLSNFDDLDVGLRVLNYSGADEVSISHSEFKYCVSGLELDHVSYTQVNNSTFEHNEDPITVVNSSFVSMLGTQVHQGTGPYGVYLSNVEALHVASSLIDGWDAGIYCPMGAFANVYLFQNAVIQNNTIGVHIEKGLSTFSQTHGLVLADCAQFINNGTAIKGEDIILKVDAAENCNNCAFIDMAPNTFDLGTAGHTYFDVCFVDSDNSALNARGNYWGGVAPNPLNFKVKNGLNCDGNISVNTVLHFLQNPGCNGFNGPQTPTTPTEAMSCEIEVHSSGITAYEDFHTGYSYFRNEQYTQAYPHFQTVANVSQSKRSKADFICRHYVDVSRAIVEAFDAGGFEEFESGHVKTQIISDQPITPQTKEAENDFKIFPNPADEIINISLASNAPASGQIYNALGQLIWSNTLDELTNINVKHWNPGVYYFMLKTQSANPIKSERIVVH